jgi:uncharacterized membrane protein YccC
MPTLFAIGVHVIKNPASATFAAFGSFAMLLLADFRGPMGDRVRNQIALGVGCGAMITLATLVSNTTWLAAVTMGAVGFGVLFAGVASSVLASATQTLLLAFILPVSLAAPASNIPDRLMGWGLAAGCSVFAIWLLWPLPARDPVRSGAIAACRALAARLRPEAGGAAAAAANEAVGALHATFFATPFRPAGLSTAARAVVRLVDELRWLREIVAHVPVSIRPDPHVCVVRDAAADVLELSADVLQEPSGEVTAQLSAAVTALTAALDELERITTVTVPDAAQTDAHAVVTALSPSFRAQEVSFLVSQIAANAGAAAAAERRTWMQRLLGRRPDGLLPKTIDAAQERAGAHLEPGSVWLRNSLRGGIGLGLAVLVAELSSVQHSFWVVLGALSVLRSSALATGQNLVRALLGTAVGFILGGLLVSLIGTNTTVLWFVLPIAIMFAGLAPAAIGFGTGQAAFTLVVIIIFDILQPAGWSLGLVRIEDVALGGVVSLVVGLFLWPRGAASALGRALAQAYEDAAAYLAGAVAYGVGRCDAGAPAAPEPTAEATRAAASSRRLDDAFRGYLSERGSKPLPMAEVTRLVTGPAGLRLAGDAVLDLWRRDGAPEGDRAGAREELSVGTRRLTGWYDTFATSLTGASAVPDPQPADDVADGRLVEAVRRDLRDRDGRATATGVRVIWTGDHLDAARRLQDMLVDPARAAVEAHALR